jgi:WD40 repeat protein
MGWRVLAALIAALWVAAPAHAARNGQIAAVSNGEYIVTFNPDGTDLRYLWAVPGDGDRVQDLAWSPDGNQLAFSYGDSSLGARIGAIDLRTGESRLVSDHEPINAEGLLRDFSPGWLPDGRIAWRRVPRGTSGGGTLMASDGTTLPIALNGDVTGIAWSPQGHVLLSQNGVSVADLTGATLDTYPLGSFPVFFRWSPDERFVVTDRDWNWSGFDIVDLADGTRLRPLAPVYDDDDSAPAFSPDGTTIVYQHDNRDPVKRVVEVRGLDLTTGAQRTIRAATSMAEFAWQPCTDGLTSSCASPPPPTCSTGDAKVRWPTPPPCSLAPGPVPRSPRYRLCRCSRCATRRASTATAARDCARSAPPPAPSPSACTPASPPAARSAAASSSARSAPARPSTCASRAAPSRHAGAWRARRSSEPSPATGPPSPSTSRSGAEVASASSWASPATRPTSCSLTSTTATASRTSPT